MKRLITVLTLGYAAVAALFGVAAFVLLLFALMELWGALVNDHFDTVGPRAARAIESIGLVAVALMALEMAQTVVEEEILRRVHVSAPTRVRRYVSRFLVVVVVALAIESLVAVVQAIHQNPGTLREAAYVAFGAAALLGAWGLFIRLNRSAEELEPESLEHARSEDHKVE
jgi:hypothetical protein